MSLRIPEVSVNGGDRNSVGVSLSRPCGWGVRHIGDIDSSDRVAYLVQGRTFVCHGDHTWDSIKDGVMVAVDIIA